MVPDVLSGRGEGLLPPTGRDQARFSGRAFAVLSTRQRKGGNGWTECKVLLCHLGGT
jgi:hypothetical protein